MHFLIAKLHVIIESGCQRVLLSLQSIQQCLPIVDIQEKNLINIQDRLMSDGAQIQEQAAW